MQALPSPEKDTLACDSTLASNDMDMVRQPDEEMNAEKLALVEQGLLTLHTLGAPHSR